MDGNVSLQEYNIRVVERIVSDVLRATLRDPKESAFMLRFSAASRQASKIRLALEREREHIPSFLIASITSSCNLHCAGCYSRSSAATDDRAPVCQLSAEEWAAIFREAEALGISFIMLAGGEPLLRRDVLETAGRIPNILFPVFTNGLCLNDAYLTLFDRCRNLVPVLSIEGGEAATDGRRGTGVYQKLISTMDALKERRLLFAASVTVTTENIQDVMSPVFLDMLMSKGCKVVIFVEYVPVTTETLHLAPGVGEREYLRERIGQLRDTYPDTLLLSFPGDEKASGGCMAAGRGFFHINSHGGAEPCPFSPYSDISVRDTSLREAMQSGFFHSLRDGGLLDDDHAGGCVLYEQREKVLQLLKAKKSCVY